MWQNSRIYLTRLICICDMTQPYMWHDSSIYVWLTHGSAMSQPDLIYICVAQSWLGHESARSHSYMCGWVMAQPCVTQPISLSLSHSYMCGSVMAKPCVTQPISLSSWAMTQPHIHIWLSHDSSTHIWMRSMYVRRLAHICAHINIWTSRVTYMDLIYIWDTTMM